MERLESHLRWARKVHAQRRVLVVTESVFSMDGDRAPLARIVELKERFGAWLLLDEAHAVGVFGPNGAGVANETGLSSCIDIHMGTLSKALGTSGGYICGSRMLIEWLINKARSFMFSTAPSPSIAAAATAAIRWMSTVSARQRREAINSKTQLLGNALGLQTQPQSAIVPFLTGSGSQALQLSQSLFAAGYWVPAIRYPTVPKGKARLRITVNALHSNEAIRGLGAAIQQASGELPFKTENKRQR
jgi:glycine C-acetyltransferase/8-amino-7-oxononanoate synthase